MSTTYPEFRGAVRAAIVEASGLEDTAVGWAQDGERCADPWIVLTAISDVPEVSVRESLEADGDSYTKTLSQMRRVAVQVRVESIDADALGLANEISLRMRRQAVRDILDAECVLVDVGGVIPDRRYRSQGLWIQARSFELFLRIVLEDIDPTPVGTIGTVKIQGKAIDLPPEIDLEEDTITEDD